MPSISTCCHVTSKRGYDALSLKRDLCMQCMDVGIYHSLKSPVLKGRRGIAPECTQTSKQMAKVKCDMHRQAKPAAGVVDGRPGPPATSAHGSGRSGSVRLRPAPGSSTLRRSSSSDAASRSGYQPTPAARTRPLQVAYPHMLPVNGFRVENIGPQHRLQIVCAQEQPDRLTRC